MGAVNGEWEWFILNVPRSVIAPRQVIAGFPDALWGNCYFSITLPSEYEMVNSVGTWAALPGFCANCVFDGYFNNLSSYSVYCLGASRDRQEFAQRFTKWSDLHALSFAFLSPVGWFNQVGAIWQLPEPVEEKYGEAHMPTGKPACIYRIGGFWSRNSTVSPAVVSMSVGNVELYPATMLGDLLRSRGIYGWDGANPLNGAKIDDACTASQNKPALLKTPFNVGPSVQHGAYGTAWYTKTTRPEAFVLMGQEKHLGEDARDGVGLTYGLVV